MIDLDRLENAIVLNPDVSDQESAQIVALIRLARADVALDLDPVSSNKAMSRNEALKPFLPEAKP